MVEEKGLLDQRNFILAGDLNFSISIEEMWGDSALLDPLVSFFKELFSMHSLVDVHSTKLSPTWCNGRIGEAEILKRLDRVYILEELLMDSTHYRSWMETPFISDHAHVFFQLDIGVKSVAYPFKLNSVLIKEDPFANLVHEVWSTRGQGVNGAQHRLEMKLGFLKNKVKKWIVDKENMTNNY
jgi:hypothetical protein